MNYMEELRRRAKESRVYSKHQSVGLEIAEILGDAKHKALYIKLAKENNQENLLVLAKSIAENATVRNKGAYFMKVLSEERKSRFPTPKNEVRVLKFKPSNKTPKNPKNERRDSNYQK